MLASNISKVCNCLNVCHFVQHTEKTFIKRCASVASNLNDLYGLILLELMALYRVVNHFTFVLLDPLINRSNIFLAKVSLINELKKKPTIFVQQVYISLFITQKFLKRFTNDFLQENDVFSKMSKLSKFQTKTKQEKMIRSETLSQKIQKRKLMKSQSRYKFPIESIIIIKKTWILIKKDLSAKKWLRTYLIHTMLFIRDISQLKIQNIGKVAKLQRIFPSTEC